MKPLVLGSASPRRAALLRQLALPFTVFPSPLQEPVPATSIPADYALESAVAKAGAVASVVAADAIVIAADTIVYSNGAILGKPADATEAASILGCLSGQVHQVYTGLAIQSGEQLLQEVVCTQVAMRTLTAADIAAYVASGEPLDKAGGYGIQGLGARFIERIAGCYYNVVGLPLARLCVLLSAVGCDLNDQAIK